MTFGARALIVLLATYAAVSSIAAVAVWAAWRGRLQGSTLRAEQLLALRLLPFLAGAVGSVGIGVPAFFRFEPRDTLEAVGPIMLALAIVALMMLCRSGARAWRAHSASRRCAATWCAVGTHVTSQGTQIDVVRAPTPIVALLGLWRTRLVMADAVLSACTQPEIDTIAAHEQAHRAARDNVKRAAMSLSPDPLAWTATGRELLDRWDGATELDADAQAVGADREARANLAMALVKVARLAAPLGVAPLGSPLTGLEGVELRVRQLLSSEPVAPGRCAAWVPYAALVGVATPFVLLHEQIYGAIEAAIRFAR